MSKPSAGPLPPLFVPLPDDREERERCAAVEARLAPFLDAGALDPVDCHVAARLGALTGALDPEVLLGLAFAVRAPRRGHVCVDLGKLKETMTPARTDDEDEAEPPELPWPRDPDALEAALTACAPLVRGRDEADRPTPFVLDSGLLYMDRYWRYQARLGRMLRQRAAAPLLPPADEALLRRGLDALLGGGGDDSGGPDRQELAAAVAALRRLTVLSGGPGMGKTYAIRVVLTLLYVQHAARRREDPDLPPLEVALAAPTGKAANRMKESLNSGLDGFLAGAGDALGGVAGVEEVREFLTGLPTFTLHRLLGWQARTPATFRHGADNPLPHQVVVVDEASMVDLALMAKLVDAVSPDSRLLLIGDRHQLASVEAGTVLADICGDTSADRLVLSRPFAGELSSRCGLELDGAASVELTDEGGVGDCIVQLNTYHRFSDDSGIGAFARHSLAGEAERAAAVLASPGTYPDVALLPHPGEGRLSAEARGLILDGYRLYLELLAAGPDSGEAEAHFHRRVLDALDRFRVLCAHRRGRLGVEGLNRAAEEILAAAGAPGFSPGKSNYVGRPLLVQRNDYSVGRFNGDVGVVVRREQGVSGGNRRRLWVAFPGPGDSVEYLTPARLPEHQTVFAMTIHKSQGSQFERVLVVLPERPSPILTRELIYTGVTRAAEKMTMIGDRELLEQSLAKPVQRASGLGRDLWQAPRH